MADRCPVEKALAEAVSAVLMRLVELTTAQLRAFQEHHEADISRLDQELENAVGEKERAIGRLDEHRRKHGCFHSR